MADSRTASPVRSPRFHQATLGSSQELRSNKLPTSLLGLSNIQRPPRWTLSGRHFPRGPSTGAHFSVAEPDVPGPGTYNSALVTSRHRRSPGCSFGTARCPVRELTPRLPGRPGPGRFLPGASANVAGWTIGAGQALREQAVGRPIFSRPASSPNSPAAASLLDAGPGPGAHELRSFLGEGPKFSAPATARKLMPEDASKELREAPGPVSYLAEGILLKACRRNEPGGFSFGCSIREVLSPRPPPLPGHGDCANSFVGPGSYSMASPRCSSPRWPMPPRRPVPLPITASLTGPGDCSGVLTTFG